MHHELSYAIDSARVHLAQLQEKPVPDTYRPPMTIAKMQEAIPGLVKEAKTVLTEVNSALNTHMTASVKERLARTPPNSSLGSTPPGESSEDDPKEPPTP